MKKLWSTGRCNKLKEVTNSKGKHFEKMCFVKGCYGIINNSNSLSYSETTKRKLREWSYELLMKAIDNNDIKALKKLNRNRFIIHDARGDKFGFSETYKENRHLVYEGYDYANDKAKFKRKNGELVYETTYIQTDTGNTPFEHACIKGNSDIVKELLNIPYSGFRTYNIAKAIEFAIENNHAACVNILLKKVDFHLYCDNNGLTELHIIAINNNNHKCLKVLLENNNLNNIIKHHSPYYMIEKSIKAKSPECTELLLNTPAVFNRLTEGALYALSTYGDETVNQFIEDKGISFPWYMPIVKFFCWP